MDDGVATEYTESKSVRTFRDLKVWNKAHELVLRIYKVTRGFPTDEKYGLISQLRRAAASVPFNIVEGSKRNSNKAFAHFLNIAEASLEETKYGLLLSFDLSYLKNKEFDSLSERCDEIGRMLHGLRKKLNS